MRASHPLALSVALVIAYLLGTGVLMERSVRQCDGHFVYTLDDPYIHLALAHRIREGGYGINSSESASPSSSILYPFLLAGLEPLGLEHLAPLLVGISAMSLFTFIVGRVLTEHVLPRGSPSWFSLDFLLRFGLGISVLCVANVWLLGMIGLEHPLHLLTEGLLIWQLARFSDGLRWSPWLVVACVVALPLIRFEGAALALGAVAVLWILGLRRVALSAAAGVALSTVVWAWFVRSRGLPFLPASVQIKSAFARASTQSDVTKILEALVRGATVSMNAFQGRLLLGGAVLCIALAIALRRRTLRLSSVFGALGPIVGLAHALGGRYDWFSRYEVYAVFFVFVAVLLLARGYIATHTGTALAACCLLYSSASYLRNTKHVPEAAKGIYEQQYQMHRFVSEFWKRPVAANDIGLVSYDNDYYVLDLYGLGSEDVRKAKLRSPLQAEDLDRFVAAKRIGLAMVYEGWFRKAIPSNWIRVARLKTSQVTSAGNEVAFFATEFADPGELRVLLTRFRATLPQGASIVVD